MTFQQEILSIESHKGLIQRMSEEIGYIINSMLMIHQYIGHYLSSHLNHFHKVLGKFLLGKGKNPPFCRAINPVSARLLKDFALPSFVRLPSPLIRICGTGPWH